MGDRATITYQLARDEVVRTLWRRVASRPRYLQSVGLYAVLGVVLLHSETGDDRRAGADAAVVPGIDSWAKPIALLISRSPLRGPRYGGQAVC